MTTARRAGATSLATLSACVFGFVVVHAMAPQWARSAGLDFWQMSEEQAILQREDERRVRIAAHEDDLSQRIAACDSVAVAVIDGRMSWIDAVDRIMEINRGRDGFVVALQSQHFPVTEERELHACHLRAKINVKLAKDPTRQAEVMARITAR